MAAARGVAAEDVKRAKKKDIGQTSQWTLMRRRFMQNKLSVTGVIGLAIMYFLVLFAPFFAPYAPDDQDSNNQFQAPTSIKLANGHFAVCPMVQKLNTSNFTWTYKPDCNKSEPIQFFAPGFSYSILGILHSNIHLFQVKPPTKIYIFGADDLGRDVLSRILYGGRVSMTIGLVGVTISTVMGAVLGTTSGYFGGAIDNVMQRVIELLLSIPTLSLFMAIAAALPQDMSVIKRYFLISIIISIIGWTGLARQVRGKVLSYSQQDYTAAAKLAGAGHMRIILTHLVPNSLSHIIVVAILAVPAQILAETSLSFIGLGMLPPAVSWGVLLAAAQQVQVVEQHVWLLVPAAFVIITVTLYMFLGDGLRDAVDPYS